jgi:hypothetical protein
MHSRGVKPAYAPEPDTTACYEVKNPFTLIEYRTADVRWISDLATNSQVARAPPAAARVRHFPITPPERSHSRGRRSEMILSRARWLTICRRTK